VTTELGPNASAITYWGVLIAWGPGADRHAKLLIYLAVKGSLLDACSHAIAACDSRVHLGAVGGLDPFALDPLRGRADLALRLQRDALRFQAAMVDPRVDVEFARRSLASSGPAFAPALDHLRCGSSPAPSTKAVLVTARM